MYDEFFMKRYCDRCGKDLSQGRIMSMFNEDCICMQCKEEETKRPDYKQAVEKDTNEYLRKIKLKIKYGQKDDKKQ